MERWGMLMICAAAGLVLGGVPASAVETARGKERAEASTPGSERQRTAHTGRRRTVRVERGKASYYAPGLAGRPMADGGRFDPRSEAAAHRTLRLCHGSRRPGRENP